MAFVGPVEDRLAIQELNAAYGDHVSAREVESWAALWAEDAVWEHPVFGHKQGRAAIREVYEGVLKVRPTIVFMGSLGNVTAEGDSASGRYWVNEITVDNEGVTRRTAGLYEDEYVRREGRWLFGRRRYQYLHQA